MSKMYKKYEELKKKDPNKIYLFKSGIFYLFLDNDAKKMSDVLHLKLTNLNANVLKCGFPVNNLDKYLTLLQENRFDVCLVNSLETAPVTPKNYLLNSEVEDLLLNLAQTDSNNLSIKEAYSIIEDLSSKAKNIIEKI